VRAFFTRCSPSDPSAPFGASLGARECAKGNLGKENSARHVSPSSVTNRNEESDRKNGSERAHARTRALARIASRFDRVKRDPVDSSSGQYPMSVLFYDHPRVIGGTKTRQARFEAIKTIIKTFYLRGCCTHGQVCRLGIPWADNGCILSLGSREHKAARLSFAPVSFRFHVLRRAILSV